MVLKRLFAEPCRHLLAMRCRNGSDVTRPLRLAGFRARSCPFPYRTLTEDDGMRLFVGLDVSLRGLLRNFGLKVGAISRGRFEARIRELVAGNMMLEAAA
jgi:hypothetical protein